MYNYSRITQRILTGTTRIAPLRKGVDAMLVSRMELYVLNILKNAQRIECGAGWEGSGYDQWWEEQIDWDLGKRTIARAIFQYPDSCHYSPSCSVIIFFKKKEQKLFFSSDQIATIKSLGHQ